VKIKIIFNRVIKLAGVHIVIATQLCSYAAKETFLYKGGLNPVQRFCILPASTNIFVNLLLHMWEVLGSNFSPQMTGFSWPSSDPLAK
jgi:hypothetical protein